jgi:chorismate lyase/3-hydroxybenzoate synthase
MQPLAHLPAVVAHPLQSCPPAWVEALISGSTTVPGHINGNLRVPIVCRRSERFTLLSGTVDDAAGLQAAELAEAVKFLYSSLVREVERQGRHCVRMWNFVPDIHGRLDGCDRYMAFNLGRYEAYDDWFGGAKQFPSILPTASAVGVSERALSVYVLAADEPGRPVENPRQIPSYHYSQRYGFRPPCFSRATQLGSTLLIGGTASIIGQDSQHAGDIDAQAHETFQNIAALITSVSTRPGQGVLHGVKSLRVHVRHAHHAADVQTVVNEVAPDLPSVEFVQAMLCRRELLVEIEGIADC